MLFSSTIFIFYFLPLVGGGYYLMRSSRRAQNIWLLIASLFFYAWGEPVFVFALMLSVLFNHFMGIIASGARGNPIKSRNIIIITCIVNLGLLFFYKYLGFVIKNVGMVLKLSNNMPFSEMVLPLGISFFTFQAISYVVDVSSNEAKAQRDPVHTALYITLFPQLVAGPIVRYADIEEQIINRRSSWDGISRGICRFITGLAKKVLIANSLAVIANHTFGFSAMSGDVEKVPVLLAWLGAIAYMLQIYFDFSGYSDMAIGLANIFGFKLKENFNYPYTSSSISEFWRRWHISLYAWFKKYVYFPLGGSRVDNKDKMVKNLFIVWLLTGIWHGAEWTFLLWGMWQFVFILFERVINFQRIKPWGFIRHVYVLLVTLFGWVIFRAEDIYQVTLYFANMFGLNFNGFLSDTALMFLREYWLFLTAGIIFSMPVANNIPELLKRERMGKLGRVMGAGYPVLMIGIFIITVSYLVKGTYNPFIYFNF